ncbi:MULTISPECIES: FkbM family methyltransferase [Okeania]|uniref:FkbM family methyltransferase n=1 Tax=Okeania hirsuta TaxID=1458930 RepID=A0A3N6PW06_9CYAN|nr:MULTISPECIES: FkbM family methyltransferase [Okeania]NET12074.1 FkbM family methyltransferase [Okeania sp. SIO1H6]NES77285.1 FkbM family methyltransferase [Okeania sp. SIO1H4]NES88482.1 FkbM family methyltransferase [Okeania sp. SIO2B9]NET18119.1 FkbM family methyltransferase [Okeania sp. SIO1H5]NET76264.1 FkbM family methyltransferase [Okeania sp. SIO1F9]
MSNIFGNIGPAGAKNLSLDFQELVEKYQLKIPGLIHIGAHYGQEYEIYQKLNIVNLVFFEPLTENFEILKSHVGENVRLFQKALGNENKTVKMYVESANNAMSSSVLQPKKHLEQYPEIIFDREEFVEMVRLDDILEDKENYNFLIIDVQGYELEVLKGSRKTLKNIDYILTEVNRDELYENCARVEELDEFLGRFDFQRLERNWEGETWGDAFYLKR